MLVSPGAAGCVEEHLNCCSDATLRLSERVCSGPLNSGIQKNENKKGTGGFKCGREWLYWLKSDLNWTFFALMLQFSSFKLKGVRGGDDPLLRA